MRKVVIALIIILPMISVLVIFSSLNIVSITVPVSVSGIRAYVDDELVSEGEPVYLDMADQDDHRVTAQVEPANASEQGYKPTSDNDEVLTVDEDGLITAVGEGSANITVTSNDKGYTAVVPVVVTSSKAYGVSFSMYDSNGETVPIRYNAATETYTCSENLDMGTYTYKVDIFGGDSSEYNLKVLDNDQAFINKGDQSILMPFSGRTEFELKIDDAVVGGRLNQTITRNVVLEVDKVQSDSGIVINGVADGNSVLLAKGATKSTVYVECDGEPELKGEGVHATCRLHGSSGILRAASNNNLTRHILDVTLDKNFDGDLLNATLSANGQSVNVKFNFSDFDFKLRSTVIKETANDFDFSSTIIKDTATVFYAVPAVDLQGVTFEWKKINDDDPLELKQSEDDSSCSIKASADGTFAVSVQAIRDGQPLGSPKLLSVQAVTKINSIFINNKVTADLAERYTVGGQKYSNGNIVPNDSYSINITVTKKGLTTPAKNDFDGIKIDVSDPSVAKVESGADGNRYLVILGSGAITVTVQWEYNEIFNSNAKQYIKLNVVKDAVEVDNYPDLVKATDAGEKVVLTKDIMLGTTADGKVMDLQVRKDIAEGHKLKSTYNTVFYEQDKSHNASEAYVKYAMEFKADVYGNGFNLNAEYFTNARDASDTPAIFRGPLVFVEYKVAASVAGQDNIAFLIRTDGVKLYGVNLLGCSDDSLYENDSKGNPTYQLNNLNKLGTTLEINADCEIVNCRIRNGRNVVRVYGGNSDGNSYFVSAIPAKDLSEREQINVTIDGCIITQGREFLVKVGANKALQAGKTNGQEPVLRDQSGSPYNEVKKTVNGKTYYTNNYEVGDISPDSFFYKRYVMTDLTLRNSVLETSGLFCVGVESNFSGALLFEGVDSMTGDISRYAGVTESWRKSGGTSFASILRLEGDVRTYDWKDVANVDSSTLIEPVGESVLSEVLKFDVSAMLKEVDGNPDYANLLETTSDNKTYVHGGIAFYGGGRNYSQIVLNLNEELSDLKHLSINIGQFNGSEGVVNRQAQLLPYAAGTHDFNFWMYTTDGTNNYGKQQSDRKNGVSYSGITSVPLYAE